MKKWLIAVVVAGLSVGAGCEAPESQPAEVQPAEAESKTSTPNSGPSEAKQGEAKPAEKAAGDKKAELPDDLADGATATYGGEFSIEGEPMTLASAMQKASDSQGPYKIAAAVEKVCKKKGCWFTLAAEGVDQPVRIRMKDYGFFVPRNVDGAQAVVEGLLKKRVLSKKQAQHYADDEAAGTDKTPDEVDGDKVEWEMTITAVKLSRS
jgi:hypothetical protein